MSVDKITKYLSGIVNRTTNDINNLLDIFKENTNSKVALFFVCDTCTENYECIASTLKKISFDINESSAHQGVIIGHGESIKTDYNITHSMSVVIGDSNEDFGILYLLNRETGYTESLLKDLSPLIGILQLITRNLHYQKKSSYECQDMFMANMSHEIRTPLNGVIGYNQLLMQTKLSAIQKNYLSSMRQCSLQLMQIINDILDFFKLSSGTMKQDIESFRPIEIIQCVTDALEQSLVSKKQNFTYQIDDRVPEFLVMDKQKLVQIVMNLVSNAHKFTPINGAIMIYITSRIPNILEIRVSDNGIGISKTDQNKIFRAFEQIKDNNSCIGTGLGLAICRKLSTFLGGDVRVQSTIGKGSTFTITTKYIPYDDYAYETKKDISLLKNKKILVVDDNTDNRILLGELLFDWEMEPVICASALEALRMVQAKRADGSRRHTFDIGLIDICMPNTGGIELAKQIKQDLPLLPLIALSSVDSFVLTKDFLSKLNKPVDKIQLLTHMCRVFQNRETPSAYLGATQEDARPDVSSTSSTFNKDIRILIAEDVPYNSNLLTTMLRNMGYWDITTAADGQEAIQKLSEAHADGNSYEILLLDLRMPIKDGYDVIIEHQKQGWNLPKIVVLTASIMSEDREKCKQLGVKYFINKPIAMNQLSDVMLYLSAKIST